MDINKNKPQRKLIRLEGFDYSMPWWYYITICTKDMKCWFGNVINGETKQNKLGMQVDSFWSKISKHYPSVETDYYVVMPNHFHGIIILNNSVGTRHALSLLNKEHNLGNVVGSFKSAVSKWAHQNGLSTFQWQSRFYDHIIRNDTDLHRIRTYIKSNPLKWEIDEYYEKNE